MSLLLKRMALHQFLSWNQSNYLNEAVPTLSQVSCPSTCLASWQASVTCQMKDLPRAVSCFQQWPDVGSWLDSKRDRHAFPDHASSFQTFSEFSWIKCSFYAMVTLCISLLHDPTFSPFEYLLQLLTFMTHYSCWYTLSCPLCPWLFATTFFPHPWHRFLPSLHAICVTLSIVQ